jgi:DNA-binding response OmpR family regulator
MSRILILEDDADLAEMYRLGLESAGHEIVGLFEAPDPALGLAGTLGRPDLVIVDEELGVHSGTAALAALRGAFPEARFLLVSADPAAVREAVRRGFDDGACKPVALRCMIDEIRSLLGAGPPAGGARE